VPTAIVEQGGRVGRFTCPEICVSFDVDHIEPVAAILGSRRPRKPLTPDQRAALVERGRGFRYGATKDGANEPPSTPGSPND
jgi:arginase family enzyme